MPSNDSVFAPDRSRNVVAVAEREAEHTVVWLYGEHDISTVASLWATFVGAIEFDDDGLVADLSGVRFIDAATVGVIIRTRDLLQQRSRSLAVRAASPFASRVLDLCGFTDLVDPFPTSVRAPIAVLTRQSGPDG